MASSTTAKSPDDWQIDDDLRTLARAEEIKNDPKRYKAALARAQEKIDALQDLQDDANEDKSGKAD